MAAQGLSPIGLFLAADWVVRGVMLLLLAASIAVWAIALDRGLRLRRLARDAVALRRFAAGGPAPARDNAWIGLIPALEQAAREARGEAPADRRAHLRAAGRLAVQEHVDAARSGLPWLASIAACGPFIGLFGTVWGIMHAFAAIAASGNTSLATVAPGIAEALFATALGLVAAIPASLAYNRLGAALASARGTALAAAERLAIRLALADAAPRLRAAE
jgi:biopolymer transport protein ExbB/TolQ